MGDGPQSGVHNLALRPDEAAVEAAQLAARQAAGAARVEVRLAKDLAEVLACCRVTDLVWGNGSVHTPPDIVRAIQHTGGWVAVAWSGDEVRGSSVGFMTDRGHGPKGAGLHSHTTCVAPGMNHRSIGFAIKQAQRAWCLERGIAHVTWTFDPLIARNAWFNLHKLGATAREYLPDHYGPMEDEQNRGEESDRLLVEWDLLSPAAVAASERHPLQQPDVDAALVAQAALRLHPGADGRPVVVADVADRILSVFTLPADVVALRQSDPGAASAWRQALRSTLGADMQHGGAVRGIDRAGRYLLERTP